MSNLASAQVTSGITVSPNPVQTVAQFAQSGGQAYEGDAGVVTVTIGPNTTFIAGRPLRFEECNLDPTSQSDCDGDTVQTTDAVTGETVTPGADGSVTFKMDLWILPTGNASTTPDVNDPSNTNPSGFDPLSTVYCDANDPCTIWVGNDTSAWSSNSFLANSITPQPAPATFPTTTSTTTTTGPTSTTTTSPTTTSTTTTTTPTSTTATSTPTSTTTTSTSTSTTTTTIDDNDHDHDHVYHDNYDDPVYDNNNYDDPVDDNDNYDDPVYDNPVYDNNNYDDPVDDNDNYDDPVYDNPVYDNNNYDDPVDDNDNYDHNTCGHDDHNTCGHDDHNTCGHDDNQGRGHDDHRQQPGEHNVESDLNDEHSGVRTDDPTGAHDVHQAHHNAQHRRH